MDDREVARAILNEISSEDLDARFYVTSGILHIKTPKISPEMTEIIKAYKQDIIDYLTTPPDTAGICRRGHRVKWTCTIYGIWVCSCYHKQPVKRPSYGVKNYWTKEAI